MAVGSRPRRGKCTDPPKNHTLEYRQGQGGSARPSGTAVNMIKIENRYKNDTNRQNQIQQKQKIKSNQSPTKYPSNSNQLSGGRELRPRQPRPASPPTNDRSILNQLPIIHQSKIHHLSIHNQSIITTTGVAPTPAAPNPRGKTMHHSSKTK